MNQTITKLATAAPRRTSKVVLLGITNLLVAGHVWATLSPATNLAITNQTAISITLSWTDSNKANQEQYVWVNRSLLSSPTTFSNLASLTGGTKTYTDNNNVSLGVGYNYQILIYPNGSSKAVTSGVFSVFSVTTSSSPPAGGTTSGGGFYVSNTTVTVTATASNCYNFVNWTEGGVVVTNVASISFPAKTNRALVANFSPTGYTITTSSSPSAGGTTSGGGTKTCGTSVTVTATASNCYNFVNWTEAGTNVSTSTSYTFTASASRALVANFSQPSYTITTSSSPSAGGTTSGGGTKTCGTSVTVTATASNCYSFVNWTEAGTNVSTSASYTFTASASRALVANFSPTGYTITTSSSPSAGGTTSGGGTKTCGTSVTVTATASNCYNFVNWTEAGTNVSTSASYSFTATRNRTLMANFIQPSYTITTSSSPTAGGSTSGGGSKVCGTSVTVTATVNAGYNFVNWTEGGTAVSTSASYTFTASASRTLVANFTSLPSYTISTSSSPTAGGTASGGGSYVSNTTVTVTATASNCYNFVNWTEAGTNVSTSASYSFPATRNRTLVANFIQPSYTITTSSSPTAGGSTSGGGSKVCGTSVTVMATVNAGYNFVNWIEGGTAVSTSASYSFTANANRTLVANFSTVASYAITASVSPLNSGTVTGAGAYNSGTTVTLTAYPASTYDFTNWTENGVVVSSSASYSFQVTTNRNLVANFVVDPAISVTASSPTAGTVSGGGNYHKNATVTITATVTNSCYTFVNWTEAGTNISSLASYTFVATVNRSFVANFSPISYTITTSSLPTAGGSTSGGGTKTCGTSVTVLATPNSCYTFANWTENGTVVSTSASYTFTASANRTLVANFLGGTSYTITTSSSPSAGGSTSGGGNYACNASCTVKATPNSGYSFVNWTENGVIVSTSTNYTFIVNGSRNLVANFSSSVASPGSTVWARAFTSPLAIGYATATDAGNNIFVAGYFTGTVDFGVTNFPSLGGNDIFAAKVSSNGVPQWAVPFGGTGDDQARSIAVDHSGNVYVTGWFTGPGPVSFGTNTLNRFTNLGGKAIFLVKLDGSSGSVLWARQIAGLYGAPPADNFGFSIAFDSTYISGTTTGAVVLAGQAGGEINFGGGMVVTSGFLQEPFLAKYDLNGNYLWAKSFTSSMVCDGRAVAIGADGSIFLLGGGDAVNLGGGALYVPSGASFLGVYLAKFSSTGTYIWGEIFGCAYNAFSSGVALTPNGNVAVLGSLNGILDFGFGSGISVTNVSASGQQVFVAEFSVTNGAPQWAKSPTVPAGSVSSPWGIAADGNGNIVVAGSFTGSVDFGGGTLNSTGEHDIFVVKYLATGSTSWAKNSGGSGDDEGVGCAVDALGNPVITGYTTGGSFGYTSGGTAVTLTTGGNYEPFLLKLAP